MTKEKKVLLEQLERLSAEGRKDELKATLTLCLFEDLRKFLNALDVKVRSKQYAAYRTKEDHVKLLTQVLENKKIGGSTDIEEVVSSPKEELVKQSSDEEDDAVSSKEEPESEQSQPITVTHRISQLGEPLNAGVQPSVSDADRVFLVQCINTTSDALTNVERKKEQVPGLKRTLTSELAYYMKRLKRIQEKDGDE